MMIRTYLKKVFWPLDQNPFFEISSRRRITDTPIVRLIAVAVFAAAALTATGCGKKAPPKAPRQIPLAAVTDLRAAADGRDVTLTWRHSAENSAAAGYLVLRAQTALTQPECPGCPQVFQKIQRLPMSGARRRQDHDLTFTQSIAGGFSYTYNVRAYGRSGGQGPDSNLVQIEGPWPDDK